MNNKKAKHKLFTHELQIIKLDAKRLQNINFYAMILISVMLVGNFSLYPAISSLMNNLTIRSTGEISTGAYARSGSARDIQAAVDWVVARGGIGNVSIPEGTFSFVEVGEDWTGARVNIPAGVNVFGAPTERYANGTVVEWKTILVMPWDVPGTWRDKPTWFKIAGSGDPNKPSRFSDIKLVGYRSIDPNSTTVHQAISINNVVDFRIDHCYFEHTVYGISATGIYAGWDWRLCRGVIDHCFFVNKYGKVGTTLNDCTVFYGVAVSRAYKDVWEDDVSKVLGKYTDYTVFIEDCYFDMWRHCVAANSGAHYVFRHNTIKNSKHVGSLDAHGWFQTNCPIHGPNPPAVYNEIIGKWVCEYCGSELEITQVGTRAIEIYNNEIIDAIEGPNVVLVRGGSGVAFNNIVGGGTYSRFLYMDNEARPEGSKCWCKDWWIWNNTMLAGMTEIYNLEPENIRENYEYFRRAPNLEQDGFEYEPYPYPHPLTIETSP